MRQIILLLILGLLIASDAWAGRLLLIVKAPVTSGAGDGSALLIESGDYLLLESGDHILLE